MFFKIFESFYYSSGNVDFLAVNLVRTNQVVSKDLRPQHEVAHSLCVRLFFFFFQFASMVDVSFFHRAEERFRVESLDT